MVAPLLEATNEQTAECQSEKDVCVLEHVAIELNPNLRNLTVFGVCGVNVERDENADIGYISRIGSTDKAVSCILNHKVRPENVHGYEYCLNKHG